MAITRRSKKKATETKANKFIAAGSKKPTTAADGPDLIPILIKFPRDLADWLTARAAERASPRTAYIVATMIDHRKQLQEK